MVTLYVDGKAVSWADAEQLFTDTPPTRPIEIRNAAGRVIAVCAPVEEPDWVKAINPEETARRMAGPFLTFEEIQKQWGTE